MADRMPQIQARNVVNFKNKNMTRGGEICDSRPRAEVYRLVRTWVGTQRKVCLYISRPATEQRHKTYVLYLQRLHFECSLAFWLKSLLRALVRSILCCLGAVITSKIHETMQKNDDHKTLLWWRILSAMSVFNIIMWITTALTVDTQNDSEFELLG